MLVENDSDIIMIDVKYFKDALKSFNKHNIPKSLLNKKQDLYNNYKCFQSKFETQISHYTDKKHFVPYKYRETPPKPQNRLHIISTNFDDCTQKKKSFTSNLNKLTPSNKSNILANIKEIISTISDNNLIIELYNSVWDFIKKLSNASYIEVLSLFEKQLTDNAWKNYIENKEWYPADYILNNKLLSTDEDVYELYCKYVTWKKGVSNLNKTWCMIYSDSNCSNMFDTLLNDLISIYSSYADKSKTHKHIIDFALEQIYIILKVHKKPYFLDIVKSFDISNLESSSKFIILDIIDLI